MKNQPNLTEDMFTPVEQKYAEAERIARPSISYWGDVWNRLKENKLAMLGLIIIIIIGAMAIIGPHINGYTYYEQDFTKRTYVRMLSIGSEQMLLDEICLHEHGMVREFLYLLD